MKQWKKIILSVALLSLAGLVDGSLSLNFPHVFDTGYGQIVPHFTAIILILLSFYYDEAYLQLLALVFGFIKDSYYVGFLGIYMIGFFAMLYMVNKTKKNFNQKLIVYILLGIFGIIFIENFAFYVYSMLSITQMSWGMFFTKRLGITVLINSLFIVALSVLLDRLFTHMKTTDF